MESLYAFEIAITLFLQQLGAWLSTPMKVFTSLGDEQFYLLVMPALYWCVDASLGLRLGIMLVSSNVLNGALKIAFHGPRPYWYDTHVHAYLNETSFGIPSGHAQNAASLWGLAAVWLRRRWTTILTLSIIFLIGLSRIYLGVHFTHDVLLGWLLGGLLVAAYLVWEKPVSARLATYSIERLTLLSFLGAVLIILLTLLPWWASHSWNLPAEWIQNVKAAFPNQPFDPFDISNCFTIAGVWFGLTAGAAWLDRKHGGFDARGSAAQLLARYFTGGIVVIILWMGLGVIFPKTASPLSYVLRFLRYSLVGSWVSFFAPLLFVKLRLANPTLRGSALTVRIDS